MKPTTTLQSLQAAVQKQAQKMDIPEGFNYGKRTYVPYQVITHLFNGPKEQNQLKQLAYSGASQGERDPYHPDFAKQYKQYLSKLTQVLNAINWDIVKYTAPNGSVWYRLEETIS